MSPGKQAAQSEAAAPMAAGARLESMRCRVQADRAKPRTTVRWMTFITLGVIVAGFFVPSYTRPYTTLLGQLVLAFLTAGFVGVLAMMRQLGTFRRIPRFLVADARSTVRLPAPVPAAESAAALEREPEGARS